MPERVGIVTTLKTVPQETVQFVDYHLNIGIDTLFLFFDDPNDEGIVLLKDYPNVVSFRCDRSHWARSSPQPPTALEEKLVINANLALGLAREMDLGWILHIDSDELVYDEQNISGLLSQLDPEIHVARLEAFEAVPTKTNFASPFLEIDLFRANPSKKNIDRALALGCQKAFFNGEYFRGHILGKAAVRTRSDRIHSMGIHSPIPKDEQALVTADLAGTKLLHFDARGFDSWKEKWNQRASGKTIASQMRANRRDQLAEFSKLYRENASDEQFLLWYKNLYFIPDEERKILFELNMLKQIELNEKLFAKPAAWQRFR